MEESRLPFKIIGHETLTSTGKESNVYHIRVIDYKGTLKDMALKETRSVKLANNAEMEKLKRFYEFMKNDPDFGKFVIDTHFVKAQRTASEPAKAFLVQKFVQGRRIDELSNQEIYNNKVLAAELLKFFKAAIIMLQKTTSEPQHMPDFYATKKKFFGTFLNNPRYSGNILIADEAKNLPQRVYFVDSGTLFGPGHDKKLMRKLRRPITHRLQLLQLKRWVKKLEEALAA